MAITIDATVYDIPIKVLDRDFEFLYRYGERTQDGVLHSELIGVYKNYRLECGMSSQNTTAYANLITKLSEPVTSHTFVFLGDTFSAYVANLKDSVVKDGATPYFRNLSFSVIAISPTYTPS